MPNNSSIKIDPKIWDTYEDIHEWWEDGSAVLGATISGHFAFTGFALGLVTGIILSPMLVISLPAGLGLDLLKNASSNEETRNKYHKISVNIGLAPLTPSKLIVDLSSEVLKKVTEAFSFKQDNEIRLENTLVKIAATDTNNIGTASNDNNKKAETTNTNHDIKANSTSNNPKYQALNKVTKPGFKVTEFWEDFIEVDNWYRNTYHLLGLSIVNFVAPPGLALGLIATIVCSPLLLISMPAGLARYGYDRALNNKETATKNALNIALSPMNYSAIIFRITNILCQAIMKSFTMPAGEGPIESANRQLGEATTKAKKEINTAVSDGIITICSTAAHIGHYPATLLSAGQKIKLIDPDLEAGQGHSALYRGKLGK